MPKVTLDVNTFKILASDTRLDILRALDKRKMTLQELTSMTNMQKATLHEHLAKLAQAELVKRQERGGHKWVYYDLSWKAKCLLHPEMGRIAVMISSTFFLFIVGVASVVSMITTMMPAAQEMVTPPDVDNVLDYGITESITYSIPYVPLLVFILFGVFLGVTLWRIRVNRTPRL
jgi:DNA-binding transcriptional ArsR family regulator